MALTETFGNYMSGGPNKEKIVSYLEFNFKDNKSGAD